MAPAHPDTGGDDLDDGLELDPELLASDGESGYDEQEDAVGFLSDEEEQPVAAASRKRKAGAESEDGKAEVFKTLDAEERKRARKAKDKLRRAEKAKRAAGDEELPRPPTLLTQAELAELLLASARATFPAASTMEIDDIKITEDRIAAPLASFTGDASVDSFAPLIERLSDLLKDAPKKPPSGTPRALILSLSGLRCADVVRAVRHVERPGGEVAKLFAKHFKVADQVKYLSHTRIAIAVGTPARVAKLLQEGALKVSRQTIVLLDIGHRDSKNRTLLSLPEVRDELWKSLFSGSARTALTGARFAAF